MRDGTETLEILLRGLAIGTLIVSAVALGRDGPSRSIRISGALLSATIAGYVVISSEPIRNAAGLLGWPARLLALGGVGAFWAFVRALFEDHAVTPGLLAPWMGLTLLGVVAFALPVGLQPGLWIAHNLAEVGLAGHALLKVQHSWRGDLVEARRRLRGPFMAGVAIFVVVVSVFEIGEYLGVSAAWYSLAGSVALAVFSLAGALVTLQARSGLFGMSERRDEPATSSIDAAEQTELDRLDALMNPGEAWRREGLTIGTLAQEMRIPEHRLRRLINDRLGHRNFAAFVNARRIEAAKRLLADPERGRQTVASLAFDLGFGSLGPFNRAFKTETGQTPTEWRRLALKIEAAGAGDSDTREPTAPPSEHPS